MKSPLNTRKIKEKGNFSNIRSNDIPDQFSEKCTHGNWWVRQDLFVKAVKMTNKCVFKIKDSWEMRPNISTTVEQKNNRQFPKIHNKNWLIK